MEALAAVLGKKRTRDVEDDSSFPYSLEREESPEAKRLREDLLVILDDDEGVVERNPTAVGELDSVLRSLEEEIGLSRSPTTYRDEEERDHQKGVYPGQGWFPDAEGGEVGGSSRQQPQNELGFLLEASDDELGLPPSAPSTSEEEGQQQQPEDETTSMFLPAADADAVDFPGSQIWVFDDDMPSPYEGFGFGYPSGADGDGSIHGGSETGSGFGVSDGTGGDLVDTEGVLFHGGLFDDFSDAGAPSDLLWRQETLPAL